jgi:hypothetical protein
MQFFVSSDGASTRTALSAPSHARVQRHGAIDQPAPNAACCFNSHSLLLSRVDTTPSATASDGRVGTTFGPLRQFNLAQFEGLRSGFLPDLIYRDSRATREHPPVTLPTASVHWAVPRLFLAAWHLFYGMAILSIEMYYAHDRGASIEAIAAKLGFSEEWVSERIEAARLSLQHQVMIRRAGAAWGGTQC